MARSRSLGLRPLFAVLGLLLLLGGCMAPPANDPARIGPFFKPRNFSGDAMLPSTLHRVILLPISGGSALEPETAATMDTVFLAQLQQKNRFEVVTLPRAEMRRRYGVEALDSASVLPHDLLASLQREFAADGVIFVDITTFRAYHPLVVGVRSKFITMDGSHVIWAFDNVFSADNNAVANSARKHFLESDRRGVPADMSHSVLQTPSRFAAYAASATFDTLPVVYSPPPPPKAVSR